MVASAAGECHSMNYDQQQQHRLPDIVNVSLIRNLWCSAFLTAAKDDGSCSHIYQDELHRPETKILLKGCEELDEVGLFAVYNTVITVIEAVVRVLVAGLCCLVVAAFRVCSQSLGRCWGRTRGA